MVPDDLKEDDVHTVNDPTAFKEPRGEVAAAFELGFLMPGLVAVNARFELSNTARHSANPVDQVRTLVEA